MRNEGNKLYVVVVVKRISTLSVQDVTHRFRRHKPRSGFPPNGAQLFLTVFLTVSREVSFEYTKIAYRAPSVKRCARARYLMNSNVKDEKIVRAQRTVSSRDTITRATTANGKFRGKRLSKSATNCIAHTT